MNQQQRELLAKQLIACAAYYQRPFPDAVLAMYVEDLEDLDFEKVMEALKVYRRDPRNRAMPLPAQIRDILTPAVTHAQVGREVSALILEAITKFGYANSADAQEYIGSIGWSIVKSFGGWNYLCTNMGVTIQPGMFIAQCREMASDRSQHGTRVTEQAQIAFETKSLPPSPGKIPTETVMTKIGLVAKEIEK